jgi:hypothetical protein
MKIEIGDYENKVNNCPTLILTHKFEDSSNGKNMFSFYLIG